MSAFVDAPIEPRSVTRSRHVFTNAVSSTHITNDALGGSPQGNSKQVTVPITSPLPVIS
jgi:hypothetical protein